MKRYSIAPVMVLTVMTAVLSGRAAAPDRGEGTLQQFLRAVDAYTQLHRQLEQDVPPLKPGTGAYEIVASSDALAQAIRAARIRAREGDIFDPEEADGFRILIKRALHTAGLSAEDMVTATGEEAPADAPFPAVNGRFPWARGAAVWPCVLLALPSLPEELQYRLVGRDLVLVDVHANLVVDILREAIR